MEEGEREGCLVGRPREIRLRGGMSHVEGFYGGLQTCFSSLRGIRKLFGLFSRFGKVLGKCGRETRDFEKVATLDSLSCENL